MTLSRTLDVAIVGAGPAGIGAAVGFERLDLQYAVFERDRIGSSFRQWPDEMRLLTPSFPANAFGVRDLNAITLDTSPALALDREHPTGDQYADYLEAVAEFHELPIETGVDVEAVVPDDGSADEQRGDEPDGTGGSNRGGFTLETSQGSVTARYVVWAAGQYQYPSSGSIPGASHAVHVSTIDSWSAHAERHSIDSDAATPGSDTEVESEEPSSSSPVAADGAGVATPAADDIVIVGGAESGIDAALGLADAGLSVTVLDDDGPWQYRSPDPSEVLSPRTTERLESALEAGRPIELVTDARVERIEQASPAESDIDLDSDGYAVVTEDGDRVRSSTPPILATGFVGGLSLVDDRFAFDDSGCPDLTDRDESTETPGLFLVGPQVAHNGQQFCFIYKFRQRFAVVAETVGERLGVDTDPLEAYREKQMVLEDLECCEPEYCDC